MREILGTVQTENVQVIAEAYDLALEISSGTNYFYLCIGSFGIKSQFIWTNCNLNNLKFW